MKMLLMLKIFVLLHPQTSGRFELTNYKSIITQMYNDKDQYASNITSVMIPDVSYGYDAYINGIYYYRFPLDLAQADFKKYY